MYNSIYIVQYYFLSTYGYFLKHCELRVRYCTRTRTCTCTVLLYSDLSVVSSCGSTIYVPSLLVPFKTRSFMPPLLARTPVGKGQNEPDNLKHVKWLRCLQCNQKFPETDFKAHQRESRSPCELVSVCFLLSHKRHSLFISIAHLKCRSIIALHSATHQGGLSLHICSAAQEKTTIKLSGQL